MKRRNGRWHKEKANRRLQELRDELRVQSRKREYIPLEKPIFAGWDIVISVEGFRRDRPELEAVIAAIGWSSAFFVRNVAHVRTLRRENHSFYTYLKIRNSYYGYNSYISVKTYEALSEDTKKYFHYVSYNYSGVIRERYELSWNFPFYALKVGVKKSYYHYKIVYDTVAESEYEKLDSKLYEVDCKKWGNRYRDCFITTNRAAWKKSLDLIVCLQLSPEEIIDEYTTVFKGTNNKKNYGWS